MRMLFQVTIPVEAANAQMVDGIFADTLKGILDDLKPEAAYFVAMHGQRCALIVVDLKDASEIPAIAEPFFHAFEADVEIFPAMVAEDLAKAMPAIDRVAQQYA